jgi:hypothetical protein
MEESGSGCGTKTRNTESPLEMKFSECGTDNVNLVRKTSRERHDKKKDREPE